MSEDREKYAVVAFGNRGVELTTIADAYRMAQYIVASGFAPRGMEKPESVFVAIQLGAELGLPPMAALQNIGVINGRPGIYGDAALGLVRASGLLESYSQEIAGTGDDRKCVVSVKRKGEPTPIISEFSIADAKRAGLWGKAGPWTQYPERMLLFRARGFALRDGFGDVLKGMHTTEELQDMPKDITDSVVVSEPKPLRRARKEATEPDSPKDEPPAENNQPAERPVDAPAENHA